MTVEFGSQARKLNFELTIERKDDKGTVIGTETKKVMFADHKYKSSDKEEIEALLQHKNHRAGYFGVVTNGKVVDEFLRGKTPTKFTGKDLEGLSDEAILKIGKAARVHEQYPGTVKTMLIGRVVTDDMEQAWGDAKDIETPTHKKRKLEALEKSQKKPQKEPSTTDAMFPVKRMNPDTGELEEKMISPARIEDEDVIKKDRDSGEAVKKPAGRRKK